MGFSSARRPLIDPRRSPTAVLSPGKRPFSATATSICLGGVGVCAAQLVGRVDLEFGTKARVGCGHARKITMKSRMSMNGIS